MLQLRHFMRQFRCGPTRQVRHHLHITAGLADQIGSNNVFFGPISSFNQQIREQQANEFKRGVLFKDDHRVYKEKSGQQKSPLFLADQGPRSPFQPADGSIAVDAHHDFVGMICRVHQGVEMTHVQKIKTAVCETDAGTFQLPTEDGMRRFVRRHDFLLQIKEVAHKGVMQVDAERERGAEWRAK